MCPKWKTPESHVHTAHMMKNRSVILLLVCTLGWISINLTKIVRNSKFSWIFIEIISKKTFTKVWTLTPTLSSSIWDFCLFTKRPLWNRRSGESGRFFFRAPTQNFLSKVLRLQNSILEFKNSILRLQNSILRLQNSILRIQKFDIATSKIRYYQFKKFDIANFSTKETWCQRYYDL